MRTKEPRTTPVPVRLDRPLRARVKDVANRLGTTASALIRFSVHLQLEEIERTGEIRIQARPAIPR